MEAGGAAFTITLDVSRASRTSMFSFSGTESRDHDCCSLPEMVMASALASVHALIHASIILPLLGGSLHVLPLAWRGGARYYRERTHADGPSFSTSAPQWSRQRR